MKNYQDILYLPHHVSKTRKPMSPESRAAQFAPFAALTGYDEAIDETVRTTDQKIILDENETELLDRHLHELLVHLSERPRARITYFVPDVRKAGGAYRTKQAEVQSIDLQNGIITFSDRTALSLSSVCAIECELSELHQRSVG